MSMLRTRRLAKGNGGAEGSALDFAGPRAISITIYTCPSTSRAIVRDVRLTTAVNVAGSTTYLYVLASGVTQILWIARMSDVGLANAFLVCDTVLEPGDRLAIDSTLTQLDYYVTGAELTL